MSLIDVYGHPLWCPIFLEKEAKTPRGEAVPDDMLTLPSHTRDKRGGTGTGRVLGKLDRGDNFVRIY